MHVLPLSEFRANASAMIDLVEKGETVIVARAGIPIMEWKAVAHRPVRIGGRPGFGGPNWEDAFTEETEAEILAMFDEV